jgi:hypothetical protein
MDNWKALMCLKKGGIFGMALHDLIILYRRKFQAHCMDCNEK